MAQRMKKWVLLIICGFILIQGYIYLSQIPKYPKSEDNPEITAMRVNNDISTIRTTKVKVYEVSTKVKFDEITTKVKVSEISTQVKVDEISTQVKVNEISPMVKEISTTKVKVNEISTKVKDNIRLIPSNINIKSVTHKIENAQGNRVSGNEVKIFVYNLPSEFNSDVQECVRRKFPCFITRDNGYAEKQYTDMYMSWRNTWQFALEMILHIKLLSSPYRTLDPDEADIFYLPYYSALACFCFWTDHRKCRDNVNHFFSFLENSTYFKHGRPHVMALSKIEKEHASSTCPTLFPRLASRIQTIGIEEVADPYLREEYYKIKSRMFIAPYPSYGHFWPNITNDDVMNLFEENERTVFMLLAASTRRSNFFRAKILNQFEVKLSADVDYNLTKSSVGNVYQLESIMFITRECVPHKYLKNWMRHSVFCLQPPGDSPTRKSFYDSIISGCIPVKFSGKLHISYPFETKLAYSDFTVTIPETDVWHGKKIIETLKLISPDRIKEMQMKLAEVAIALQYSYPPHEHSNDAVEYLIQEMKEWYKIPQK